jgi:nucleoid DNA-binding protein
MPVKKKRKTTVRKATKSAPKKTAAKKSAPKKVVVNTSAIRSALNKSQLLAEVAEATELSKKQVSSVVETIGHVIHRHLKKGGAGEFTLPGLIKCVVKRKPATKARKGVNPFTGEMITFKAKPARNIVKVRALKKLKAMVE